MKLFSYSAHDHCTGRRWVSTYRARSEDEVRSHLVAIYGRGLEVISVDLIIG